jgi:uncharacterized protein (TIGR02145 family)
MEKSEVENKLKKINELFDAGLITKAEFNELLKSEVMGSNTQDSSSTDYKLFFKILTGISVLLALYSVIIFFLPTTSENKVNSVEISNPSVAETTKGSENSTNANSNEILTDVVADTATSEKNISVDVKEMTERKPSNTIQIGNQIWTSNNLNTDHFNNGEIIPQAQSKEEWKNANKNQQPAWCYLESNSNERGKLYNWYAVSDSRGLAPEGYRIPTIQDWFSLVRYFGSKSNADIKMKQNYGWGENPGNNESGFAALPFASRRSSGNWNSDETASWWSYDSSDSKYAFCFQIIKNKSEEQAFIIELKERTFDIESKGAGLFVRLIKE